MIRKEGRKYILLTKDGSKVLGKHNTLKGALRQEKAIKISQKKRKI